MHYSSTFLFHFLLPIPVGTFALFFLLSPESQPQNRGHKAGSSPLLPPTTTVRVPFVSIAITTQQPLPSRTRVESCRDAFTIPRRYPAEIQSSRRDEKRYDLCMGCGHRGTCLCGNGISYLFIFPPWSGNEILEFVRDAFVRERDFTSHHGFAGFLAGFDRRVV